MTGRAGARASASARHEGVERERFARVRRLVDVRRSDLDTADRYDDVRSHPGEELSHGSHGPHPDRRRSAGEVVILRDMAVGPEVPMRGAGYDRTSPSTSSVPLQNIDSPSYLAVTSALLVVPTFSR